MKRIVRIIRGELPIGYVLYRLVRNNQLLRRIYMRLYKCIWGKKLNVIDREIKEINVGTYDGMNQLTHPDVILFKDNMYLTATPYPYSDEKYENPCLFSYAKDKALFLPIGEQPIIDYKELGYRYHYSDPALSVENEMLILYYRKSEHKTLDSREDYIYKISSNDAVNWTDEIIVECQDSRIIAPSFVNKDNSIEVYYVYDEGAVSCLKHGFLINNRIVNCSEIMLDNIDNMCIWHVDVKFRNDHYIGLFTYMEKPGAGETRLFLAKSNDGIQWIIKKQITFGKESNVKNIYKATSYIRDDKEYIIASAIDSHYRWRLYETLLSDD